MLIVKSLALGLLIGLIALYPLWFGCLIFGVFSLHGDGHIEVFFALEFLAMLGGFIVSFRWLKKRSLQST